MKNSNSQFYVVLLLILCFRSENFSMTLRAGGSLFIITTYHFSSKSLKILIMTK